MRELVTIQATERLRLILSQRIGRDNSAFQYDRNEKLSRAARVYGAVQNVIPATLQSRVLYLSHYAVLTVHPGGSQMYDLMRWELYLSHMENDLYQGFQDCN